jgi:hypothetical protein
VPRSVAMKLTGHKTESIYRRYAIVAESDLKAAGEKLNQALGQSLADPAPAPPRGASAKGRASSGS